jgi:hypothetical protein
MVRSLQNVPARPYPKAKKEGGWLVVSGGLPPKKEKHCDKAKTFPFDCQLKREKNGRLAGATQSGKFSTTTELTPLAKGRHAS